MSKKNLTTIQKLIDDKVIMVESSDDENTTYSPPAKVKLYYKGEKVINVDVYADDEPMIITMQGRDHFGEYGIKSVKTKVDVEVYKRS